MCGSAVLAGVWWSTGWKLTGRTVTWSLHPVHFRVSNKDLGGTQ